MDTSEVKINQVSHILPHQPGREKTFTGGLGEKKYASTIHDKSGVNVDVPKDHVAYGHIQSAQNQMYDLSKSIRVADETMGRIEDFIEKMKKSLVTHLKNFPPFLQGSEERVKLLKIFNSFRKQIDQLTFPPEDHLAGQIMAGNLESSEEKTPLTVDEGGIVIQRQPVHTGYAGLNISSLPLEATDEMIQEGIDQLEAAQTTLKQRRESLAQDLRSVLERIKIS